MAGRKLKRLEIARFAVALLLIWGVEAVAVLEGLRIAPYFPWLFPLIVCQFSPGMAIESWLAVMRKGSANIVEDKMLAFGMLYVVPPIAAIGGRLVQWQMVLSIVWFAASMVRIGWIIVRCRKQGSVRAFAS